MTYKEFLELRLGDIIYRTHSEYEKEYPYIIIEKKIYKNKYIREKNYIEYTAGRVDYNPYSEKYFYYEAFISNDTYQIFTKGEKIKNWGFK